MDNRSKSNEALVKRLLPSFTDSREEREVAWSEWVALNRRRIECYIRKDIYQAEIVEDIFQDTIAIAYQNVESGKYEYRQDTAFRTYVIGIANNLILDERRRAMKAKSYVEIRSQQTLEQYPLENEIEQREKKEAMRTATTTLSPRRAMVIELYRIGWKTAEIAQHLGLSEDLVRQEKRRGILQLQGQCLEIAG